MNISKGKIIVQPLAADWRLKKSLSQKVFLASCVDAEDNARRASPFAGKVLRRLSPLGFHRHKLVIN